MDELQALSYFSSLNHISRIVAFQERSLIKYLGNKWTEYSPEEQAELLDDLCVSHSIRDEQPPVADDEVDRLPICWPTLKLPSGEKIIVDENDIWTWRDEHSGPFSWKSKSQQDLSLADLEPDNLTKSHSKSRKESESEDQAPPSFFSQLQFVPKHSSWTQAVLDDFFDNLLEEVQTPTHTAPAVPPPDPHRSMVESPSQEVNAAFEGSVEDLSPAATPSHVVVAAAVSAKSPTDDAGVKNEELQGDVQVSRAKGKGHKTPSPKKLLHPMKKDSKGDTSHQLLIVDNRDEEKHAFSNPAMEVEWSNFVGESSTDPGPEITENGGSKDLNGSAVSAKASGHQQPATNGSAVSAKASGRQQSAINGSAVSAKASARQQQSATVEPPVMVMDRGGGGITRGGDESAESTPDHTTQLLTSSAVAATREEVEEKEEVVYVVDDGAGSVTVQTSDFVASPSESDEGISKSGYDFLDNW